MQFSEISKLRKLLVSILLVVLFGLTFFIGIYFWKIGGSSTRFSENVTDWAHAGDYFAGVIGPILSFAAFLGVLATVYLQIHQIQIMRSEYVASEMKDLITRAAASIDSYLFKEINNEFKSEKLKNRRTTIFDALSISSDMKSMPVADGKFVIAETVLKTELNEILDFHSPRLAIEFKQLAWAIYRYQQNGGATELYDFYGVKYINLIFWMYKIGYIEKDSSTFALFGHAVCEMEKIEIEERASREAT